MKELHIWGVPRREAVNEGVEHECLGSPKRGSQRCKASWIRCGTVISKRPMFLCTLYRKLPLHSMRVAGRYPSWDSKACCVRHKWLRAITLNRDSMCGWLNMFIVNTTSCWKNECLRVTLFVFLICLLKGSSPDTCLKHCSGNTRFSIWKTGGVGSCGAHKLWCTFEWNWLVSSIEVLPPICDLVSWRGV